MVVTRSWGWGEGDGELLSEYRISVFQDERSSVDGLHHNVNILNTTELYT